MTNEASSCCQPQPSQTTAVRFHLSLNVAHLERSIAFFRTFLGCEPAKYRSDYAKFELNDPPLVLSLEPFQAPPGGNLNHLGFRMPDSAALVDLQRRLELAGISTRREDGVECCYSRQTKFWVDDPDGNLWEVYTLHDDLEHRGDGHLPVVGAGESTCTDGPALSIWAHRLGEKFPQRLPILNQTVDRVTLQGTLNKRLSYQEQLQQLSEVRRILKPAGLVQLHMLTSDRPMGEEPFRLPGPAALVESVPEELAVFTLLADAGFSNPRITFRGQSPCFRIGECELRETRLEAAR